MGDEENRQVEQGVVAEQAHVAALAGGQQDGRSEAPGERRHRERARILQQRQRTAGRADRDHQPEGPERRQQPIEPESRKHGEVHHRHAAALQGQRKTGFVGALAEPHPQQRNAHRCHRRQAELDRQQPGRRRVARKEGQADEQNHQAHTHDGVAAQEPALGREHGQLDGVGLRGLGNLAGLEGRGGRIRAGGYRGRRRSQRRDTRQALGREFAGPKSVVRIPRIVAGGGWWRGCVWHGPLRHGRRRLRPVFGNRSRLRCPRGLGGGLGSVRLQLGADGRADRPAQRQPGEKAQNAAHKRPEVSVAAEPRAQHRAPENAPDDHAALALFLGSGRQALGLCAKGAVVLVDPPATARAATLRTNTPVRDTRCRALQARGGEGACGSLAAPL